MGKYYTKRTARSKLDVFPSKTGAKIGYPDYVFYENEIIEGIVLKTEDCTFSAKYMNNEYDSKK